MGQRARLLRNNLQSNRSFYSILDDSDCKVGDATTSSSGSATYQACARAKYRSSLGESVLSAIKSLLSTPNEVLSDDAVFGLLL